MVGVHQLLVIWILLLIWPQKTNGRSGALIPAFGNMPNLSKNLLRLLNSTELMSRVSLT